MGKRTCGECGRFLRQKHFRINRASGESMCKQCIKRVGENKFYTPDIERIKRGYKNYDITFHEKQILFRNIMRRGVGVKGTKRRIDTIIKQVKNVQKQISREEYMRKNKTATKKLVEGLK